MYVTAHLDAETLSNLVTEDGKQFSSSMPSFKRIGFLQANLFNLKVVMLKKTPCIFHKLRSRGRVKEGLDGGGVFYRCIFS